VLAGAEGRLAMLTIGFALYLAHGSV
jgi:hypothetical protein